MHLRVKCQRWPYLNQVEIELAASRQTGMIGVGIQRSGRHKEENTVAINESTLTKAQVRELNGLRQTVSMSLATKRSRNGVRQAN